MESRISYGNYLEDDELQLGRYNQAKPKISYLLLLVLVFWVVAIILEASALGAMYFFSPAEKVDNAEFIKANKISQQLNGALATLKETRKNNLDCIGDLSSVLNAMPEDVYLTEIDINADKVTVKGTAVNPDTVNDFCSAITISKAKPVIDKIASDNGVNSFSITVNKEAPKPKKGGKAK